MADWREQVKKDSQSGNYPKLEITMYFKPKTVEGKQHLAYYSKEESKDKYIPSMKGILVGHYMKYTSFDANADISYNTTPFFNKENKVKIFCASSKGQKVPFSGTADEAKGVINKITNSTVKMVMVLVVLREKGFVTIETNMSLGINLVSKVEEKRLWKLIKFSAKKYVFEDFKDAKLPEKFVKLAATNSPTYCLLEMTEDEIDEKVTEDYKINDKFTEYMTWKKSVISGNVSEVDVLANETVQPTHESFPTANYPDTSFIPSEEEFEELPF